MRYLFTTLSLLVLLVINLNAALEPVRIAVTIRTPSPTEGHNLLIDVLNPDGSPNSVHLIKHNVKTDKGGVISVVIDEEDWLNSDYNSNYLVRITYNGIVLSIERMEVFYAKQGLFGASIDPNDVDKSGHYYFGSLTLGAGTDGEITIPTAEGGIKVSELVLKDDGVTGGPTNFPNTITLKSVADVTPDRTIYFPNEDGTVVLNSTLPAIANITADYSATNTDGTILVDASAGGVTVTLPTASAANKGLRLSIKKIDSTTNSLIIVPATGTIDGGANKTFNVPMQGYIVQSNGTGWFVVGFF